MEAIPDELKKYPPWLLWCYDLSNNKNWAKVPYSARTGRKTAATMKKGLVEFQEAEAVFSRSNGRHEGIGFATFSDNPFTFMDVDHCRSAKGELTSESLDICGTLTTYTEYGLRPMS